MNENGITTIQDIKQEHLYDKLVKDLTERDVTISVLEQKNQMLQRNFDSASVALSNLQHKISAIAQDFNLAMVVSAIQSIADSESGYNDKVMISLMRYAVAMSELKELR